MNKRGTFVMYSNYYDIFSTISYEKAGQLIIATLEYVKTGQIPKMPDDIQLGFKFMKNQIDFDTKKYKERCEKNRQNALKRHQQQGQTNDSMQSQTNECECLHNDNELELGLDNELEYELN